MYACKQPEWSKGPVSGSGDGSLARFESRFVLRCCRWRKSLPVGVYRCIAADKVGIMPRLWTCVGDQMRCQIINSGQRVVIRRCIRCLSHQGDTIKLQIPSSCSFFPWKRATLPRSWKSLCKSSLKPGSVPTYSGSSGTTSCAWGSRYRRILWCTHHLVCQRGAYWRP